MSRGKLVFNKIYGELAKSYADLLKRRAPGMSEHAIYAPYEQFYSKDDKLILKTRMLIMVASLVSQSNFTDFEYIIHGALNASCSAVELSETIMQMGIYIGEPISQMAMDHFQKLLEERDMDIQREYEESKSVAPAELPAGDAIFRRLFGDEKAEEVYNFLRELSPELEGYAISHPFGEFYAKEHLLDLKTRELITIASLVTTGMLPQLKLHIGAALYIGCTLEQIEQMLLQMGAHAGNPKMLNAMKVFQEVRHERISLGASV